MRVNIKPLSVNKVWQGKRYKTKEYEIYEKELLLILKNINIPDGNIRLDLIFGFSNKASDWDNPIKPFVDILQKRYGFNDSRIYESNVKKVVVKKGLEFIDFEISEI